MSSDPLTAEHWSRVEALFEAALDRPARRRGAFLRQAAAGDPALEAEVASLLAAHEGAGSFLSRPALQGGAAPAGSAAGWIGRRIGPYVLTREVGRGGSSLVFLAARSDREYEQQVAVKVVRAALGLEHLVARFRRERQILAQLDHPYIARLHDGGTLPEGLPYFVMELVEGEPMDRYCDGRRLDLRQRLELFLKVCDAVAYAHRNLVVHRDLKPANILVTRDGVPKLLDFGIAKLLAPSAEGGDEEATHTWLRALTPQYASPEQVAGGPITTATDVYSLGVVLYQLLCGRLPHRVEGLPPAGVEREITEVGPPPPSSTLRIDRKGGGEGEAGDLSARARARRLQPHQLRRRLAGDLDNVVLMALRKEPERRYGSVELLAADLRRHLEQRPVEARRDTFAYRARRLVQRNRLAAALAAALFTLALGFSVLSAVQALHTARERDRARQALEFLVDLFQVSDPLSESGVQAMGGDEPGGSLSAEELLEIGSREARGELGGYPELRATVLGAIGEAYLGLEDYQGALPLLTEALELRRTHGAGPVEVAANLQLLGEARYQQGEFGQAEALYRRALALRRRHLGAANLETAASLVSLSNALRWQDRFEEAEAALVEAVEMGRAAGGFEPYDESELEAALAGIAHERGRLEEAEARYRRAVESSRRAVGAGDPRTGRALVRLGAVLEDRGELLEAEALFRRALALWEPHLGAEHPAVLATRRHLGVTLGRMGELEEAERGLRWVLARRREKLGPEHPKIALTLYDLAGVLAAGERWVEAEGLYRRALELVRRHFGEEHFYTAVSLTRLGGVVRERGDLAAAEGLERRALALLRHYQGGAHANLSQPLLELGRIELARGRPAAAEPPLREALAICRGTLPPAHPWTAEVELVLGACLLRLGRCPEADRLLAAAADHFAARLPPHRRGEAESRALWGEIYRAGCPLEAPPPTPPEDAASP